MNIVGAQIQKNLNSGACKHMEGQRKVIEGAFKNSTWRVWVGRGLKKV